MGRRGRKSGVIDYRTIIRIERAVSMEASGFPDEAIVTQLGFSTKAALTTLKRNPLYSQVKLRLQNRIVGSLEEKIVDDANYIREKLKQNLPIALQVLVDALGNPDPKVRLTAASEVLDREGHLAKVSRIGLPSEEQGGSGIINTSVADALINNIKALKSSGNVNTTTGTPIP